MLSKRVRARIVGVDRRVVAWRTVGAIAARVVADARAQCDPFDGLTRIGIGRGVPGRPPNGRT
ncbi:MAG: hypothetical protein GY773_05455 [Actinomycetia bacterium]|nr:hypothetical protein [Actinomycetes bacterium]MCP5031368.1 hypothetical protein [Actinomycetes bacterium]